MTKVNEELINLSNNFRTVGLIAEHADCVHVCEAEQGEPHELSRADFVKYYEVVTGIRYTMKAEYIQPAEGSI